MTEIFWHPHRGKRCSSFS